MPVIYDVSYKAKVRPERPLSMTVVASGVALACSPVSAAMAAMITLTDVAPYNFSLVKVVSVTIPAAAIGIFVSGLVMMRRGVDLEEDPEYRARLADGRLTVIDSSDVGVGLEPQELTYTRAGRNAAFLFLTAVMAIVVFGMFDLIRPTMPGPDGVDTAIGMTPIIQMLMFTVAAVILLVAKPNMKEVPDSSVFKAGIVSAVALFGLAWLTDTFIGRWEPQIAAANFDETGTTRLGTRLLDHWYIVPVLLMSIATAVAGAVIASVVY